MKETGKLFLWQSFYSAGGFELQEGEKLKTAALFIRLTYLPAELKVADISRVDNYVFKIDASMSSINLLKDQVKVASISCVKHISNRSASTLVSAGAENIRGGNYLS